jgi:hypothetical protein
MTPEQERQLDDLREEVQAAARAMQDSDTNTCCYRLVDAFLLLMQYLESLDE